MMIDLYLPGYSLRNKRELEAFVVEFESKNRDIRTHQWRHWEDENIPFDIETELANINEEIDLDATADLGLMGKSIGTVVAMNLLERYSLSPSYVVLLGIPLGAANEYRGMYNRQLSRINCPKFVFQNQNDPFGSSSAVRDFLAEVEDYELIEMPADTHKYDYAKEVIELI